MVHEPQMRKENLVSLHPCGDTLESDNNSQEADLMNIAPSIRQRRVRTVFFVALLCACQLTPALCRSPWWLSSTGKDERAKDFKDTEGNGTVGSTTAIPTIPEGAKVENSTLRDNNTRNTLESLANATRIMQGVQGRKLLNHRRYHSQACGSANIIVRA